MPSERRTRLVFHGAALFLLSLLIGIPFSIALLGDGEGLRAWRVAHLQALTHGLLLLALGAVGGRIALPPRQDRWLFAALLIGSYGAVVASVIGAAFGVRGLSPGGSVMNTVAWLLFATGVAGISVAGTLAVAGAWRAVRGLPGADPSVWVNWAGIVRFSPKRVVNPRSVAELQQSVVDASRAGERVRAVGNGYSWSPMVPNDGVLIGLSELTDLLSVEVAESGDCTHVRVEAGMSVRDFVGHLRRRGLALESAPVLDRVQMGGAVALGCHGTGRNAGTISDQVVAMEVVGYDGQLTEYAKETTEADVWNSLIVNLGALGIVYSITMRCVPNFGLKVTRRSVNLQEAVEHIDELVTGHDYAELFWMPFEDIGWTVTWDKTDPPNRRDWLGDLRDRAVQWLQSTTFDLVARRFVGSAISPVLIRGWSRMRPDRETVLDAHDAFHYHVHFPRVHDVGHAIPVDPSFDSVRRAWNGVVERIGERASRGEFPHNIALHARFLGGSEAYLSPTFGSGPFCCIEALTHIETPGLDEYFAEIERLWLSLGGRPHWAKFIHDRRACGDSFHDGRKVFLDVRSKLDPDGIFLNDFVREMLQIPDPSDR